jgi:hypothetical protein
MHNPQYYTVDWVLRYDPTNEFSNTHPIDMTAPTHDRDANQATTQHEEQRRRLAQQISEIDAALPGSLVIRSIRCGKPTCRCKADPPQLHGPYIQWTRKIAGRTRTRLLTPEQLDRYRPWFENAQRIRQMLTELEDLSLQAANHAEGWTDEPPNSGEKPAG